MPSKKQYNLVNDDAYDCRIPLYNEEAFHHGITFHAKYIGSLDVPRPTSRVEIVAAMRRIRYEFKAKSVKKKKVSITVSVEGVKVLVRNKKKSNQWLWDENKFVIMHHPIYRIFYVSHDSQDLKIFSYIARDGSANAFRCNVFKSKKKSQAMRIVRTVGQAFEVCHKLSLAIATSQGCNSIQEDIDYGQPDSSLKGDGVSELTSCDTQVEEEASTSRTQEVVVIPALPENPISTKVLNGVKREEKPAPVTDALNLNPQMQWLKDRVEAQNRQMEEVSLQVQMLKDQLAAETTARLQSQAQNEQLLAYNKQLLEHIAKLISHFYEQQGNGGNRNNIKLTPQLLSPPQFGSHTQNSMARAAESDRQTSASPRRSNHESAFSSHNSSMELKPITFDRQLSLSANSFPIASSSPRLDSHHNFLMGQSLPASPLRQTFPIDAESQNNQISLNGSLNSSWRSKRTSDHGAASYKSANMPNAVQRHGSSNNAFSPEGVSFRKPAIAATNPLSPPLHSTAEDNFWSVNQSVDDSFITSITRDLAKLTTKPTEANKTQFPILFDRS